MAEGSDREYSWDKLPGETPKAFQAFTIYRDMPPSERSIRAAWFKHLDAELKPRPSYTTTAPSNWRQWSTANQWVQRASDHDGDLDRRARLRMAEDLIKARNRIKDIGVAALVKLAQRLASASSDEIEMRTWSNMFARASEMVLRATGGYLPQGDSDQDDEDLD